MEIRGATTAASLSLSLSLFASSNETERRWTEKKQSEESNRVNFIGDKSEERSQTRSLARLLSNLIRYHLLQQPAAAEQAASLLPRGGEGDLLERQEAAISTARQCKQRRENRRERERERESKANGDMAATTAAAAAINCKCSMTFGVVARWRR